MAESWIVFAYSPAILYSHNKRFTQAASCLKPPGRKKTPGISLWNYDVDMFFFFQICLYHHHHQVNLLSRNERQEAPSKKYRFM